MALRRVPFGTRFSVFFRSFAVQASFSPQKLQTLGPLFALMPALRRLYPNSDAQQRAVERYLQPFNTQPYMATGLIGAFLHQEERIAAGEAAPESVAELRTALAGPLAAIGDGFFWLSLRPAVAVLALGFLAVPSAALAFMLTYSFVHLGVRVYLFRSGYRDGAGIVAAAGRLQLQARGQRLRFIAPFALGAIFMRYFGYVHLHVYETVFYFVPVLVIVARLSPLVALYGSGFTTLAYCAYFFSRHS